MWKPVCFYLSLVSLSLFSFNLKATAQSITPAPDGTGTLVELNGNTYNISGGTTAGANLFHSFIELGLSPNEIANFLANPQIENILGRVNGGNPSIIQGLLKVSGSNANLYLMNPAGIIFAPGASLDVPNSFMATTADGIGFAGGWFNAVGDNNYQDLTGSPTSFSFLSSQPGAIINTADLSVNNGANLSLMGGTIVNTGTISAQDGNITLTAVPGEKVVRISQEGQILSLDVPEDALIGGITPVELPALITNSTLPDNLGLGVNGDGTATLAGIAIQSGDLVFGGSIAAETVNLNAANTVTPVPSDTPRVLTGDGTYSAPTVWLFPQSDGDPKDYVFIDATVPDYAKFLYGGKPGTVSVVVTPEENGITKITETLQGVTGVDALHILSEGNQGNFWLGNAFVSSDNVGQYSEDLQSWGSSLNNFADILIYACFTALGSEGAVLIETISNLTGADVAASTNLTGSASLGGDWVLEASTGNIESGLAFGQEVLDSYDDSLAIFTVANLLDSGMGSLRDRINSANTTAGDDEIRFAPSVFNGSQGAIELDSEVLIDTTTGELTIDGGFTGSSNVVVDAQGLSGVFNATGGGDVTFKNITIRNGNSSDYGGGIFADGDVNLLNTTVSGNMATGSGGGIFAQGDVTLTDSTVSDNEILPGGDIDENGGGIFAVGDVDLINTTVSGNIAIDSGGGILAIGEVRINNSTIAENEASNGGGIFAVGEVRINNSTIAENEASNGGGIFAVGDLELINSTISENEASNGGGILAESDLELTNSTISGNNAENGGGIFSRNGNGIIESSTITDNEASYRGGGLCNDCGVDYTRTFTISNSIIAGNLSLSGEGPDVFGENINGDNNNLIGDLTGIASGTLGTGSDIFDVDPQLAPLDDYGGPTETHALLPGSDAINTGVAIPGIFTDQRGQNRGISVDIGAFEVSTDLAVSKTVDNGTPVPGDTVNFTITVTNNGPDAVGSVSLTDILPPGVTFTDATTTSGSYDSSTGVWTLGNLDGSANVIPEGTTATLTLTATVDADAMGTITNMTQNLMLTGEETNPTNNQGIAGIVISSLTTPTNPTTPDNDINTDILPPEEEEDPELPNLENPELFGPTEDFNEVGELDAGFTSVFEENLGLGDAPTVSFDQVQNKLQNVVEQTGTKPAVIYAFFVPQGPKAVTKSADKEKDVWQFNSFTNRQQFIPGAQEAKPTDELELVVVISQGKIIRQRVPGATREKFLATRQKFLNTVNNPTRLKAFLKPSQQLHEWLIKPLEKDLQARDVNSLVLIMDEGWRSTPVAALHDGEQFLIERYSISLMPSFALSSTPYQDLRNTPVLAMGAEEFTNQAPLPAVPLELSLITQQLWQGETFLNQDFTIDKLQEARETESFGILHLATHGVFNAGKPDNSFIYLGDKALSLNDLGKLNLDDPQINLLVLSACETALGDTSSELGFAGLSVLAGVKSALGSLWRVDDVATLGLMTSFYQKLKLAPVKAEALQEAQLAMMRGEVQLVGEELVTPDGAFPTAELSKFGDQDFVHPYYWSGFTMVGSPW